MFDNKTLKAQSAQETLFPGWTVCARLRGPLQNKQITLWGSGASIVDKIHKIFQNGRLGEYSLKQLMS